VGDGCHSPNIITSAFSVAQPGGEAGGLGASPTQKQRFWGT
jgi:hypothetical protein